MKTIKLTARQIQAFDEIGADKNAAEATLKVALTFHSNLLNQITKLERDIWKELAELHDLDLSEKRYETKIIDGCVQIKEMEN